MKKIYSALFLCLLFIGTADSVVDNSVTPQIEFFENKNNLDQKKYSKHQFAEIEEALSHLDEKIRILSFNLLFSHYDHNLSPENRWPQRLPRIVEVINEMQPDIIGVQELYPPTWKDLQPLIEKNYTLFAKPCDDGELNGILYHNDRFEVVDSLVWYISETPEIPNTETLTMLKLKDLKTGHILAVFNAHLAFSNINKREYQARFLAKYIKSFIKEGPVVLTGDFNTFSNRPDLHKLPFYDGDYILRILKSSSLSTAKENALLGHLGPISTFTNLPNDVLPFKGTGTPGITLDHIFISNHIKALIHATQAGTIQGLYPSDHMPVLADIIL